MSLTSRENANEDLTVLGMIIEKISVCADFEC